MIAAGAGIPLYWLAEADHTARGTAAEQSEPTYRHYRQRQLFFGWAMRRLCVDALQARGITDVGVDDVVAEFSELDRSQSLVTAAAVSQLTETLATAQEHGWLTPADAAMVYQHYVGMQMDLPPSGATGEGRRALSGSALGATLHRPRPHGQRGRARLGARAVGEPSDTGLGETVGTDPTARIEVSVVR
jgi:hypothetical protein